MADIDAPLAWRMQQDGYLMRINQLEREDRERGELIEDMWALWHSGCDCTECPGRVHAECRRDERLGVRGCNAMGYVRERAAAVGIELEW